jgi:hypothetical protein
LASTATLPDGHVREVEARLLIPHETAVERAAAALMARIGGDDGESACESGPVSGGLRAERKCNRAVQPTAALEQETSIPGLRQRDGKADPIPLAVYPDTAIDHPVHAAIRREIGRSTSSAAPPRHRGGARGNQLRVRDVERHTRRLKPRHRRALRGCLLSPGDRRHQQQHGDQNWPGRVGSHVTRLTILEESDEPGPGGD